MGNIFLSSEEPNGQAPKSSVKVLNAKQFLDVEKDGLVSANDFLASGEEMRVEDFEHLKKGFQRVKAGDRIVNTSTTKLDKGNRPYKFYTFLLSSKANDGVKLISEPYIEKMMELYKAGLLQITFTLDELIAEARKA